MDKNIKEYNYESFVSYEPSLKEHLLLQLNLVPLENKEHKIGEYIIQNIDNNGYLNIKLEEIANYLKCSIEEVEIMLGIVQTFEPLGVGARSLSECLLIQVGKEKYSKYIKIIEDYLEILVI